MNKEDLSKKWDEHFKPSPETRERLARLETNQSNLMQEIQELKEMIKNGFLNVDKKIDCALEKKADKWVENTVRWVLYFIAAGLLTALGTLIYKAIIYFK